jgi:predicted HD superfamily hydrolase involved in NAD metabolism
VYGHEELKLQLKQSLSRQRYSHSVRVAEIAAKLADYHGSDPNQAYLAGLLHDCAKGLSAHCLLQTAVAFGIVRNDAEKECPGLLHGQVGALLAWKEYGVKDPEILTAIALHTLGAVEMGVLTKIIYIADVIELGRDYPGVDKVRVMAFENLDQALLLAMDNTIASVLKRGQLLHPQTVQARNSLLLKATTYTREREKNDPDKEKGCTKV